MDNTVIISYILIVKSLVETNEFMNYMLNLSLYFRKFKVNFLNINIY